MHGGISQAPKEHTLPPEQVPQFKIPPQPSLADPHSYPSSEQVFGMHGAVSQVPALHISPAEQVPQFIDPSHPSDHVPQSWPSERQVAGVHLS